MRVGWGGVGGGGIENERRDLTNVVAQVVKILFVYFGEEGGLMKGFDVIRGEKGGGGGGRFLD